MYMCCRRMIRCIYEAADACFAFAIATNRFWIKRIVDLAFEVA